MGGNPNYHPLYHRRFHFLNHPAMGATSIGADIPALAPPGRRSFSLNHQRSLEPPEPPAPSLKKKGWRMFNVINQPNSYRVYTYCTNEYKMNK